MATLGIGRAYVFVTIFYLASLALTFGVSRGRPVPDPSALPSHGGPAMSLPRPSSWREMLDGLLYVWARPKMLATMWLAFLVNLTAYPAFGGLLPYVAKNIYETDANGLGWLVASFSFGALLGSIGMVVTGGPRHPERSMVIYTAIWYALLLAFGYVTTMTAGIAVLIVTGIAQSIAMISMAASLLARRRRPFPRPGDGRRSWPCRTAAGTDGSGALVERIGFPGTITVYRDRAPLTGDRHQVARERVDAQPTRPWPDRAMIRPICFVGALASRLNVQKVRLAGCLRAPPRSWTLLIALAGFPITGNERKDMP
jgi:hypothetical protein